MPGKAKKKAKKKAKTKKRKTIIPNASIKRLLKEHGATKVSAKAVKEVQRKLADLAKKTVKLTRHAKRKTVQRQDIPEIGGVQ